MLSSLIVSDFALVLVVFKEGNSVASVKSNSLGIFFWVVHDHPVFPVILVPSCEVATDELGEISTWCFFIAAEYFDVPEFVNPKDPVGLNCFANCGL